MKRALIIGGVILLAAIFLWRLTGGVYNKGITLREDAIAAWNNVESSYQRRADLIDNLVKTVQGAADFERTTLTEVIEARAKATSVDINAENLTPEAIANFQQAQSGLSSALSRLLVTVERYPDIKANQNFLELQSQLEGTENRINVARDRYNGAVAEYNKHIQVFPNNIISGLFNLDKMNGFKADPGAEQAPEVDFNFD